MHRTRGLLFMTWKVHYHFPRTFGNMLRKLLGQMKHYVLNIIEDLGLYQHQCIYIILHQIEYIWNVKMDHGLKLRRIIRQLPRQVINFVYWLNVVEWIINGFIMLQLVTIISTCSSIWNREQDWVQYWAWNN